MTVFNKGDRVRYVFGPGRGLYSSKDGVLATVIDSNDSNWIQVKFDGDRFTLQYEASKFDLVERAVPATVTEIKSPGGTLAIVDEAKGAVNHPAHYGGDTTYETWKVAEAWGLDEDAYLFNVLKYISRAGKKGAKQEDLEKAEAYLKRRIEHPLEAAK